MRKLNAAQPIVFPNGTMQPLFRDFLLSIEDGLSVSWGQVSGTPTTLAGYGITDALALTGGNLTGDFSVGSTVFFVDVSAGVVSVGADYSGQSVALGANSTMRVFKGGSTSCFVELTTSGNTSNYGVSISPSDQGMRYSTNSSVRGHVWDVNGTDRLSLGTSGNLYPGADGTQNLGAASFRWSTVYATTGTINTSDRRLKRNISALPVAAAYTLVGGSQPVRYRWKPVVNIDGEGQESIHEDDQYYLGYIAQDVGQAIQSLGINPIEYAMFHHCQESDRYGMRYTEMIAPIHTVVNDHTARIESLENALAAAMSRIAALEALP